MKRKIAILMSTVLLISALQMNLAFAVDTKEKDDSLNNKEISTAVTSNDAVDKSKTMELSIEDAVKLAKESSREMWKIDDVIRQMQDQKRKGSTAKEQAETLMSMSLSDLAGMDVTSNYLETLLAKNNYYVKIAETKTKEMEKNKELLNVKLEIETKSLYYGVLVDEKTIEINQGNLSKAEEQLRVINLKFNNGSATKAEVLNGQMAVQNAQTDLDSSKDDLEFAKLDLLNKIDLPFETKIALKDKELKYIPTVKVNIDEALEKAKTDRPEILAANNNLEVQKIETHAYTAYYTSNLWQNKSAVEKLKDAELNIPQVYKNVELDVRKSHLALVKAERALVNADKRVELAKEASRINKLLYENGMVASTDVIVADTNLAQAEIGRYQLLVAYNINKMVFDNSNLIGSMK